MRTIPPDSRLSSPNSAESFVHVTATTAAKTAHAPDLVASTRSYLACLTAGLMPQESQAHAWNEFHRRYTPAVGRAARGRAQGWRI